MTEPAEIPIIDLTPLISGAPGGIDGVARQIGEAARGIGFFALIGHGISAGLQQNIFDAARALFALPVEAKETLAIEKAGNNRGWVRLGGEALDPARPADIKEAFNIGLDLPPGDPDILAGKRFRGPNVWPPLPAGARRRWTISTPSGGSACCCTGPSRSTSACRPAGSTTSWTGRWRPCACCATRRPADRPTPARSARGSTRITAISLCCSPTTRRPGGAHPRRALDHGAHDSRRVHHQYRRLPDALDQRRLCLDAASRHPHGPARAHVDRVLPGPQSGRGRGGPALLHRTGPPCPLSADQRRPIICARGWTPLTPIAVR